MSLSEQGRAWKQAVKNQVSRQGLTLEDLEDKTGYKWASIKTWLTPGNSVMPSPRAANAIHNELSRSSRPRLRKLYSEFRATRSSPSGTFDWLLGEWIQEAAAGPVEWSQHRWKRDRNSSDTVTVERVTRTGDVSGTIRGADRHRQAKSWTFFGRIDVLGPSLRLIFTEDDDQSTNGVIVLTLPTGDRRFLAGVYVKVQPANEGEARKVDTKLGNHIELDGEIPIGAWSRFAVPRPLMWHRKPD